MIRFKQISYKNFFSAGNYPIVIDLDQKKNILIHGVNGSGKSTFCSAICYALYGKPYKDVLKGGIINSINKKDLLVEITFQIGSDEYKVRRGMKPNIFEIYMNGQLLNVNDKASEYQSHLEKNILQMSFHTFKQTVIIGNSGFTPFLKLPAGQRREMIEDILDLSVFSKMNVILKSELSDLNNQKNEIDNQLFKKQVQIESEEEKIKFIEKKRNSEQEEKRKAIEKKLSEKEALLAKIPTEFPDLDSKLKELNLNQRKIESKQSSVKTELSFLEKEIKLLECATCPTCKQEIGNQFKLNRLSEIEKEKSEKTAFLEKSEKAKSSIKSRIIEIESKIDKRNQLLNRRSQIEFEIKSLKDNLVLLEENNENEDIKTIILEKEKFEKELEDIEKELKKVSNEVELRKQALNVLKDNGVKSKIIRTYIPVINRSINEYLEKMDFFVSFEIDENFNETIRSRHRDVFTYENFSDGEKSRIDLAFLFTWRKISKLRNGISTNLLILDEVFSGSLDSAGVDDLNSILHEFEDNTVFVITHRLEGVMEKFSTIYEFTKPKHFTLINRTENDLSAD